MPSRLSKFCEGVIEGAWLAALILVPVFFNIYSSRIFEPDKIALLRSIAVIILIAQLVKIVEDQYHQRSAEITLRSIVQVIRDTPLLLPVILMIVVYLVATIFSITPRVSLWGSYQRLQGTYTTLSYIIIFLALLFNLRRHDQLQRLITVIIIASIPVVLYGVLQHYKLDPIPWGGDTSIRIAANMGNSIFVAAYLIMIFPLTVMRILEAINDILTAEPGLVSIIRATIYLFIAIMQLVALFFSGSRGPALGWIAGLFFMFLMLSLYWKKRWLVWGTLGLSLLAGIILFILNLPNGPLQGLRSSPAIGRFGSLLDAESNSALVRKYIWQGAASLVAPHSPLEFPDGSIDRFNVFRPLIGYGPEAMYVAYNPFYIPALAQVERRNASPDRSHNETWDALVITGLIGMVSYLFLFMMIFYFGLESINLHNQIILRRFYWFSTLVVAIIGAIVVSVWRGWEYFGVGLPLGILVGMFIFLSIVSLIRIPERKTIDSNPWYPVLLIALLAAIVSHFVEINFGIAIASTRLYFWVYCAILVVVGTNKIISDDSIVLEVNPPKISADNRDVEKLVGKTGRKRKVIKSNRFTIDISSIWQRRKVLTHAILIALLMCTLGYSYINNPKGLSSSFTLIWSAFTSLPKNDQAFSGGILVLILLTWLLPSLLLSFETHEGNQRSPLLDTLGILLISAGITIFYWLWHAGSLVSLVRHSATTMEEVLSQVQRYESLLTQFYFYIGLLLIGLAVILGSRFHWTVSISKIGFVCAVIALLPLLMFINYFNLRVIQADIVFKLAEPFARMEQWPVAVTIYNRANQLAPNEDYYYLFLGRAYIEYSQTLSKVSDRDMWINQAEADLKIAQSINPLNTDHTANLARLYNLWASATDDLVLRTTRANISSEYFSRATKLSPNSARLWDEWAVLSLNLLRDSDRAKQQLDRAREIDPDYHWTYAILGQWYTEQARNQNSGEQKTAHYKTAILNYQKALELPTQGDVAAPYNYYLALGNLWTEVGEYVEAITAYQHAAGIAPAGVEIWRIDIEIANLYLKSGDLDTALASLEKALVSAPESQKERIRALIQQMQPSNP